MILSYQDLNDNIFALKLETLFIKLSNIIFESVWRFNLK